MLHRTKKTKDKELKELQKKRQHNSINVCIRHLSYELRYKSLLR